MTKWNKAIQCEQIWWLIIAYTWSLRITREWRDLVFPANLANSFQWSEDKNTSSPKVWWIFFWVRNHLSSWYAKDRNCGKAHWEKIEKINTPAIHSSEINYKRFREGAALHLFLIFTRVEIKINGLISDRCRSFFSFIKWYLPNARCRVFKEYREPESMNNLHFTLAEFACSNSLAFSRQNAGSSWESWLQNPMKFYQSLWGFKKVYKPFQQRNYHEID